MVSYGFQTYVHITYHLYKPYVPPLADILAEMGRDMLQISQISLKIRHFYTNTDQIWS